jgi:hypothetical protein
VKQATSSRSSVASRTQIMREGMRTQGNGACISFKHLLVVRLQTNVEISVQELISVALIEQ